MAGTRIAIIKDFLYSVKKNKENELCNTTFIEYDNISAALDSFIVSIIESYRILNPDLFNTDYITIETQEKIESDIVKIVACRLSKNFYTQLSTLYDYSAIADIIHERIVIHLIPVIVDNNAG